MSTTDSSPSTDPEIAQRQQWLRVLSHAPADALERHVRPVLADHRFEWLRAPELGLVMLRARIGNTGDRFNVGEATVTRCVRRLCTPGLPAAAGVGVVLGRDASRAESIAGIEALMQLVQCRDTLHRQVIEPLQTVIRFERQRSAAATEASRVQFYTLQAEVSP